LFYACPKLDKGNIDLMTIACVGCKWFDEEEIITPDYKYKVPWCSLHDVGFTQLPSECKYRNIDLSDICKHCNHHCMVPEQCMSYSVNKEYSSGRLLEICMAFEMATKSKSLDI
jgi:hypothetical protein